MITKIHAILLYCYELIAKIECNEGRHITCFKMRKTQDEKIQEENELTKQMSSENGWWYVHITIYIYNTFNLIQEKKEKNTLLKIVRYILLSQLSLLPHMQDPTRVAHNSLLTKYRNHNIIYYVLFSSMLMYKQENRLKTLIFLNPNNIYTYIIVPGGNNLDNL